jgi:hypothetical protein
MNKVLSQNVLYQMRISLLLLILLLFNLGLQAQKKSDFLKSTKFQGYYSALEVGIGIGESHYYGDLSHSFINFKTMHRDFHAYVRYQYTGKKSFKLSFNKGTLSGSDVFAKKPQLLARKLSFETKIYELGLFYEYHFRKSTSCLNFDWTPYVSIGLAGFYFNPYAAGFGYLRPLSTEGQRTSSYPNRRYYSKVNVSFPICAGVKFYFLKKFTAGLEMGYRKTFTDYIDDVSKTYPDLAVLEAERGANAVAASYKGFKSNLPNYPNGFTRGNPKIRDNYFITMVTVGYFLITDCRSEDLYNKQKYGCQQQKF